MSGVHDPDARSGLQNVLWGRRARDYGIPFAMCRSRITLRSSGVPALAHFGDERGLAVCGEQDWSTECHLMISGKGGATEVP